MCMPTPTTYKHVSDETAESLSGQLNCLGAGIHRSVYDLGEAVLKVAAGYPGMREANLRERDTWEKVKDTDEAWAYAGVLACAEDGSWLVMEKAETTLSDLYGEVVYLRVPCTLGSWYRTGTQASPARVHAMMFQKSFPPKSPIYKNSDLHAGNVGIMADGRTVAIDYADTCD